MSTQERAEEQKLRQELVTGLRKLARWKSNDAVRLAFLEQKDVGQVDKLDLAGVVELKRSSNGAFEVKFVDRVRVLAMLWELAEEHRDGVLEDFLDGLSGTEDGDDK